VDIKEKAKLSVSNCGSGYGCEASRLSDCLYNLLTDGGEVVSRP
jgi:hypothetical protein